MKKHFYSLSGGLLCGRAWRAFFSFFVLATILTLGVFFIFMSIFTPSAQSAAGVVNKLSYQGRLTDTSGNALGGSGTNYCFRFSVYDASSGGNKLWPSGTPATTTLSVVNGVFNADIGSADALDYDFYPTSTSYLNVDVYTVTSTCTGGSWETLTPRQQILASGYTIAAENVYGDLLRTDIASSIVQIGTGAGVSSSTVKKLALDVANTAETIGSACSVNGTLWYNSNGSNARTLVCEDNVVQAVANSENSMTITTFTSSGTWAKADYPGLVFTRVIVTGGGGGGGEARGTDTANEAAAGGGGAGGTSIEILTAAELGATETVTIGSGGSGGTGGTGANGSAGGDSSFGTLTTALGGSGGFGISTAGSDGASGGTGANATSTGDINLGGGGGGGGSGIAENPNGGTGGSGYWGGGGAGGAPTGNTSDAGNAGKSYGAGGGGAASEDVIGNADGGRGTDGAVVTFNYTGAGADLAEWYETRPDVEAGDVVGLGHDSYQYNSLLGLQRSAILEKVSAMSGPVGVVASAPFQILGRDVLEDGNHPLPIALAGRVPVKVSQENGVIKSGDLLTISSIPGVAMRSTKAGITIGQALEDAVCESGKVCKVLMIVNTVYSSGAYVDRVLSRYGIHSDSIDPSLDYGRIVLAQMLQDKKDFVNQTVLSEIFTDRVVAALEIVSPRVVTDELVTRVITSVDERQGIEIGTAEAPVGMTFYDLETKEPQCVFVSGGELQTFKGRCNQGEKR